MFRLTPLPAADGTASIFGDALGSIVAMTFGPDGALYYSTYTPQGSVDASAPHSTARRWPGSRRFPPRERRHSWSPSTAPPARDPDPGNTACGVPLGLRRRSTTSTTTGPRPCTSTLAGHLHRDPARRERLARARLRPGDRAHQRGNGRRPVPIIAPSPRESRFAVGQSLTLVRDRDRPRGRLAAGAAR